MVNGEIHAITRFELSMGRGTKIVLDARQLVLERQRRVRKGVTTGIALRVQDTHLIALASRVILLDRVGPRPPEETRGNVPSRRIRTFVHLGAYRPHTRTPLDLTHLPPAWRMRSVAPHAHLSRRF